MDDHLCCTEEEMINLLRLFVENESGSNDKEGVDRFGRLLKTSFQALGFLVREDVQTDYGNHLVFQTEDAEEDGVLIVGHMDTVFERGTIETFPFRVTDRRLYGPGVIDMKGSLVMLYVAMRTLRENGKTLAPFTILLNSDEEVGSVTSRPFIEREARHKRAALVLEPARKNGDVVTSRRGGGQFIVRVDGISAHSGIEPEKGANAIEELNKTLVEIEQLSRPEEGLDVTVVGISGGVASNVVPPYAEATIDVRVSTVQQMTDVERLIRAICAVDYDDRTETYVEGGFNRPPMEFTEGTNRLWQTYRRIAHDHDVSVDHCHTGGGSDASFPAALGIPTIDGLGPIGGGQHTINEYMKRASFVERTVIFKDFLETLTK